MAGHDSSDKSIGNDSFKSMSYDRSIEHDLNSKQKIKYVLVPSSVSADKSIPKK